MTTPIFLVEAEKPMGSSLRVARSFSLPTESSIGNICHFGTGTDHVVLRPAPSRRSRGSLHLPAFLSIRSSPAVPTPRKLESEATLSTRMRCRHVATKIRGGSSDKDEKEEDYDEEDEYDEDEESSDDAYDTGSETDETDDGDADEEYDSYEEEDDEDEAVVTKSSLKSSVLSKSHDSSDSNTGRTVEYDDLLVPPAMQQLGITMGVMMLSNRVDILNAKAVQIARYAFLAYVIAVQVFLLYVRFRAKSINDRTPITINNPLASLVLGGASSDGASGGGGNFMVKALAGQVLSTQTTVLEYDLKEAVKMNGGLLFPMVFLYFLHFRMKQVQPLIMQTATGVLNLVYSPLFQVYVMGKNLERPFKPPVNPMLEAMQAQQESQKSDDDGEEAGVEEDVASAENNIEEESENEGETDSHASEEEQDVSDEEEDSEYDLSNE